MSELASVVERDDVADVMIDLETLGVKPTSAIIQIGACTLDERHSFVASIDKSYYDGLHKKRDFTFTYDDSTLEWWESQTDAKDHLGINLFPDIHSALVAFASWYTAATWHENYPKVWANSPAFDLVILNYAFSIVDLKTPWEFWQERCYRTLKSEFGFFLSKSFDPDLTPHRADHDAIMQSRRLRRILDRLSVAS